MRKIIILTALIISISSISAQPADPSDYTEAFDYVFRNISRADATTRILYERVLPFAQLYNYNSNVYSYVDTISTRQNKTYFRPIIY